MAYSTLTAEKNHDVENHVTSKIYKPEAGKQNINNIYD